jgi:hypothetical protein
VFVYRPGTNQLLAASAGATADETILGVPAGSFDVYVVQFATAVPGDEQDVHVHAFAVPGAGAASLGATPASQSVRIGATATVTASWSGLTAGRFYLGVVEFGDGTTVNLNRQTVITITA